MGSGSSGLVWPGTSWEVKPDWDFHLKREGVVWADEVRSVGLVRIGKAWKVRMGKGRWGAVCQRGKGRPGGGSRRGGSEGRRVAWAVDYVGSSIHWSRVCFPRHSCVAQIASVRSSVVGMSMNFLKSFMHSGHSVFFKGMVLSSPQQTGPSLICQRSAAASSSVKSHTSTTRYSVPEMCSRSAGSIWIGGRASLTLRQPASHRKR